MKNVDSKLKESLNYCLKCKNPECRKACPADCNIPLFIKQMEDDNFEDAMDTVLSNDAIPFICGYLCDHQKYCEGHCIRSKKGEAVKISYIKQYLCRTSFLQIFDKISYLKKTPSIAIIGAGPTGLATAITLIRNGIIPTIYEKSSKIGGIITSSLPNFRFNSKIIDKLEEKFIELGVKINYSFELGKNLKLNNLLEYDYLVFCIGANKSNSLFDSNPAIFNAIDILKKYQDGIELFSKKRIIVIGGGNVACDVARTLNRSGNDVNIIYRKRLIDAPASQKEITATLSEGVVFKECLIPKRPIIINNKLVGIEVEEAQIIDQNNKNTVKKLNQSKIIKGDIIIEAIGSKCDYSYILDNIPELFSDQGELLTTKHQLSNGTICFFGGDYATGPLDFSHASSAGVKIANSIIKRGERNER